MKNDLAEALNNADWSGVSIGNKCLIKAATEALSQQDAVDLVSLKEIAEKCGGKFHGPRIESLSIPERCLLDFARKILKKYAPPSTAQEERNHILKFLRNKLNEWDLDHAYPDPDTNATLYDNIEAEEYAANLDALILEIEALPYSQPTAQGVEEWIQKNQQPAFFYMPEQQDEYVIASSSVRAFLSSPPLDDGMVRVPVKDLKALIVNYDFFENRYAGTVSFDPTAARNRVAKAASKGE